MRYLFINTAVSVSTITLIENDKVVSSMEEYNAKDLSEKIFLMIDKVLVEGSCLPHELDKIFVVIGPGSFTGIRIGLAIAKTMAWALKIDLIPISSLELLASTNFSDTKNVIALIDARRNYVYAGGYDSNLKDFIPDQYIKLEVLLQKCQNFSDIDFVSYDDFESLTVNRPVLDYLKVVDKHKYDQVKCCHSINPIYLKLTEAEEKRNCNDD